MKTTHQQLIAIFSFVLLCSNLLAQTTKQIVLSFNANDFTYTYDNDSNLVIGSEIHDIFYRNDITAPSLPFIDVNVLIGRNDVCSGVSVNIVSQTILMDIDMADNPEIIPAGIGSVMNQNTVMSTSTIYPDTIFEYTCVTSIGGYRMVNMCVSPFKYNVATRSLSLISQFEITISSYEDDTINIGGERALCEDFRDDVRNMIVNPDDMDILYPTSMLPRKARRVSSLDDDNFDYVIITDSSLVSAFMPLADWKNQKGVRTRIVTEQQIDENYTDSLLQLKIKHYLKDRYDNDSIQYALLGGDDDIIPAFFYDMKVVFSNQIQYSTKMPVDMFYACFGGSFNWNKNNDDIMDENLNDIDFEPEISLTRLPVRTIEDVNAVVNKIINYEKKPPIDNWNNSLLMGGTKVKKYNSIGTSDVEIIGNNLYNIFIKDVWQGQRIRFYDTKTDFPEGEDYDFSSENLQTQLSNGFAFADIMTHGSYATYQMEHNGDSYGVGSASILQNSHPTIITTSACYTNDFIGSEDCLSESFIKNKDSWIIAYLGCSKQGFYSVPDNIDNYTKISDSPKFNGKFYNTMFRNLCSKNFGKLVDYTKVHTFPYSTLKHNTCQRWIVFGTNPIGDPEMPIFTCQPKRFTGIGCSLQNGNFTVNTGTDTCRICFTVTDEYGNKNYIILNDTTTATISINDGDTLGVCITKQLFVPYIITIVNDTIYLQDEVMEGNRNLISRNVVIGKDVTNIKSHGPVVIKNGKVGINFQKEVFIKNNFEVKKGSTLIISPNN